MKCKLLRQAIAMSKYAITGLLMQLIFYTLLVASDGVAQLRISMEDIYLTLDLEDATLEETFRVISEKTDFKFAFDVGRVHLKDKVTTKAKNESLSSIFRDISRQANLRFRRVNDNIFVTWKNGRRAIEADLILDETLQGITVTGRVTSLEDNEGLPGVNVIIKDTNHGTVTDVTGQYQIDVPSTESILVFSSVGFMHEEIAVGNRAVIDIALSPDIKALEEIVVVGYGAVKKSDLTGAVSQVKSEEISAYPASDMAQALQGRAAGVQVQSNNGEPGSSFKVRVRGATSINSSSDPLYVVDGFPGAGLPSPEDIESIEILKDASATAIYGSRGANGVILVTTKRGKEGKTKIEFNTSYSLQNVIKKLDLLETPDYLDYMEDARRGTYDPNGTYPNTDWQDEIYRNGGIQNYQVSLSGGNDNITYYVSGVVYDQEGIVIDSEFKRYSLTTNLDIQANKNLKFGVNLFGAHYLTNGTLTQEGSGGGTGTGVTSAAVLMEPTVPIYNADGSYAISPIGDPHDNPVAIAKERTLDRVGETIQGNFYGEFKITKDLSLRSSLGVRMWNGRNGTYTPTTLNAGLQVNGEGYIDGNRNSDLVTEHYLTYARQINDTHDFSIMGGYSYQSFHNESWRAISQNFITDAFVYWDLDGGSVAKNPSSSLTESELASVYGRLNYKLLDRYLITVNARYDGSSRFAKNNKWAFFPSGAVAWNVADEAFMENVQQISQLKIRASYGVTGNQAIAPYQSLAKFRTIPSTIINNTLVNAVAPNAVANENLTWESTAQTNFGFDLGLFDHRIVLVADYYRMKTTDLLFSLALPEYSGYTSLLKNIGSVENKGFEITLSTLNIDGDLKWSTDLNFSRNRNKILELPDGNDIFIDSGPGHMVGIGNTQVLREGEPMGQFFGYIYDGVYQDGDDFLEGGGFEKVAGGEKFRDLTGDGQLTGDDRAIIGDPNPDFIWGLNNTLEYKGFDLNFFIHAMQGNDIYSFTLFELELLSGYANSTTRALDRWTPTNTNTEVPKATDSRSRISSNRFVYDGSFIRLKNLSLGYKLPKQLMDQLGLGYARIYVSGQNLLTFTKYPGVDPEVNWRGVGDSGGNINLGLDYGGYPAAKSYTIGVQVKF